MKYYLIAGESSGDVYGGLLMAEILKLDPKAEFRFWGGPAMKRHSFGQLKSIKETSFMGFWEVAKNAKTIKSFFDFAKYSITQFNPDIVIFIDYPGFNLRMCKWAKSQGYNTAYYISPQLWAWKENRHKILKAYVDLFFVILPFERDFYRNLDTPCIYVGHPLQEIIINKEDYSPPEKITTIGLFPGSRKQEIQHHLKTMLEFAMEKPEFKFIIAGVSHIERDFYLDQIDSYAAHIDIVYDKAQEVMQTIDFAIASSGTATLELALHKVPQIVIYKTSQLSFFIAKRLVKTNYISLVNLVAQKEVVPELLQAAFNTLAINEAFQKLEPQEARTAIVRAYDKISNELGHGDSSKKVAQQIFDYLSSKVPA